MRTKTSGPAGRPGRIRAAHLTALLACPLLVLTTACSGGSDDGDAKATPSADRGRSATPAATRLEKAALAQGDLKGYRVTSRKAENWASGQPKAGKSACQPLADITGDKPSAKAKETVRRGLNSHKAPYKGITAGISRYSGAGARSFMRELKSALSACSGGFSTTLSGRTVSYRQVRTQPTKAAGDDIVGYRTTASAQGTKIPMSFVAVRSGSTIALFLGVDFKGLAEFPVPRAIVDKQLEKLRKAGL
ncbi:hypothetical protein HUT19_24365 [Streptomyces sp. NA02950]|uniref:hypothetical protein n=1 Tax=Streptomyces sp. NA02950 TaxID=2742137 RepID=UPI0015923B53|nr:hypothetical protein [Streptomyces sp. NA02950]QKV94503.1 hypothetical protein HUT19_24365 [Streptomyces sp. NA02950]